MSTYVGGVMRREITLTCCVLCCALAMASSGGSAQDAKFTVTAELSDYENPCHLNAWLNHASAVSVR